MLHRIKTLKRKIEGYYLFSLNDNGWHTLSNKNEDESKYYGKIMNNGWQSFIK